MRSATIAAREVADHLLGLATGEPQGLAPELAGPQVHELPDLTRRLLKLKQIRRLVLPVKLPGITGKLMANGGLLPESPGPRGVQTFDEWLGS